jgi:hypothetical protein
MSVLALVFLVSAVLAQNPPQPCESPIQWTALYHRWDQMTGYYEHGLFWYDSTRYRIAEEIYQPNDKRPMVWRIDLHNVNPPTRYDINVTTSVWTCTKSNLTNPFRPYGVLPNSTFVAEEVLGSTAIAGAYVDATRWQNDFINGSTHDTVTLRGCVPLRRTRVDNTTNPNNVWQEHWYDVVIGISNPNVFTPPPQCF